MFRKLGLMLLSGLLMSACYATQQVRRAEPTGFLGQMGQLREGEDGEALLLYINPNTDFSQYNKILMEPVTIWTEPGSKLEGAPEAELQALADALHERLKTRLQVDYLFVERKQPGTLKLRAALTEARSANVTLDTVSTTLPIRPISRIKKIATGTHAFVGRAGIEAEMVDAMTGERALAAVDRRAGGKTFEGVSDEWADVTQAFDDWARRLEARLDELRERGAR